MTPKSKSAIKQARIVTATKTTISDTHTITYVQLKHFTTRLQSNLIDLINAESDETGISVQRIVHDIISAHYAESIGK